MNREFRRFGPHEGVFTVATVRAAGGDYYLSASTHTEGLSEQAVETVFSLLESNLTDIIEEAQEQP